MPGRSASARLRIGIDTGGTFTDIVSVDIVSGATQVTKVASTPANPAIADTGVSGTQVATYTVTMSDGSPFTGTAMLTVNP